MKVLTSSKSKSFKYDKTKSIYENVLENLSKIEFKLNKKQYKLIKDSYKKLLQEVQENENLLYRDILKLEVYGDINNILKIHKNELIR